MRNKIKDNEGKVIDNIMYVPKPKEWFVERIGKRIYRDMQGEEDCCNSCADITTNGLVVADENHADYLACIDMDFGSDGVFSNYRDNK